MESSIRWALVMCVLQLKIILNEIHIFNLSAFCAMGTGQYCIIYHVQISNITFQVL